MAVLLHPFELAINATLEQDPETHQKLAEFHQRSIVIHVVDLHFYLHVSIADQYIRLDHKDDEHADLLISGSSLALIKLGQHPDNLFSPEIKIHGDVQFAKQLQHLLEAFDFDWEHQISRITGDVIAQPLTHQLKQSFSWLYTTVSSLQQTTSEYLREEIQLLPHKIQVEDYMNAVDRIRADMDRIEARIQRLESKK